MRKISIFLFLTISITFYSQPNGVLPRIFGRVDGGGNNPNQGAQCEETVKVSDEKTANCLFNSSVFYPVFIENFNFKEDLLENFQFTFGYQDYDASTYHISGDPNDHQLPCGVAYFGNAYNNNIDVVNGKGHLKVKQEQYFVQNVNGCNSSNVYDFTASLLNTLPRFKTGIFVAKIKLPDNPNFWPALWLFGTNPQKQEIDIFEHYDHDLGISVGGTCDQYRQMKMTNHRYRGLNNGIHCVRDSKFPTGNNFFSGEHIYQLTWTDYRVLIYVDNILVGVATKYYDKPWHNSPSCSEWRPSNSKTPQNNYDCIGLNGLPNTNASGYNKVFKDGSFPTQDQPMSFILNNRVYYPNNSYANFTPSNMEILVDYMYVWQQMDCNVDKSICNLTTFFNQAGGTNYLTGRAITVGDTNNCSGFYSNVTPVLFGNNPQYNSWHPHINMLAREEIGINAEAAFEEGTYFRAEIVDCNNSNTFLLGQKNLNSENKDLSYVPIPTEDEFNALLSNENQSDNIKILQDKVSAINLFPNPTNSLLYIDIDEQDYNNLSKIEITNTLGQKFNVKIEKIINLNYFTSGVYYVSFYLNDGNSTTKKIIKE